MITMNIHIPSDNRSITEALADLDAKLAAWGKAMSEAQSQFKEEADNDDQPTETAEQPVLQEIEAQDTSPDIPEAPEENESDSTVIDTQISPSCVQDENGEQEHDWSDEDKELFASLDKETSATIRVMRRLSFGKISVRELLEISRTTERQPKNEEKLQKKSWFSRKRG